VTDAAAPYAAKQRDYFQNARREILPLVGRRVERVLEVGCGDGNTLALLKEQGLCDWAAGIEVFPAAAAAARHRLDAVFEGSVEHMTIPLPPESLDLVLCLDVLEHLVDPWAVARRLAALLKPGGAVIASIPNVRNFQIVLPLLLRGRWDYTDSGLLDRTHLRFFTLASARKLFDDVGLRVREVGATGIVRFRKRWAVDVLTLSALRSFLVTQYLIRAEKVAPGEPGARDRP
jgi:2-polyprenyl-3-methyl-5-hydroxy-6-metoxy-1,4-benzoquinol methylase